MGTLTISLPDALKSQVDEHVAARGLPTRSAYVRVLIRRDLDRQHLRGLTLLGAQSRPGAPVDDSYFEGLRDRVTGTGA